MLFYRAEERYSLVESLRIAGSTVVFRQSIDSECDGVELLLGIERPAFMIDAPVSPAQLPVDEMPEDVILRTRSCFQIFGAFEQTVRL